MFDDHFQDFARNLLTAAPAMEPVARAICTTLAGHGLEGTIVATAHGVPVGNVARLPVHADAVVSFEDLSWQPHRALTARLLVGVFDATRLITREDVEIVEQLFFTRPRGTYGFVFVEASRLADADDLERVLRAGWRLLVPEPKPRWMHQNLAEHDVFLFDDRAAADDLDLPIDEARGGLKRLAGGGAADNALAQAALLYAIDTTMHAAEQSNVARTSTDALRRVREQDVARDEIAGLRVRLVRRIDSEAAALHRVMDTAVIRLRRDLVSSLEHALRGGETKALQPRASLGRSFQRFLTTTVDRWIRTAEHEIEQRAEEIERELTAIVRSADWTSVNKVIAEDAVYPQPILDVLQNAVAHIRLDAVPPRAQPQQPAVGLPQAGWVALGSSVVYVVTHLAGPIPAVLTSLLLGAGGWAIYREQGIRQYMGHGQGVIRGVTEQMRLQIEETIDSFVQQLHAALRDALQQTSERIAAAEAHASSQPFDLAPLRSLRDEVAALDPAASARA